MLHWVRQSKSCGYNSGGTIAGLSRSPWCEEMSCGGVSKRLQISHAELSETRRSSAISAKVMSKTRRLYTIRQRKSSESADEEPSGPKPVGDGGGESSGGEPSGASDGWRSGSRDCVRREAHAGERRADARARPAASTPASESSARTGNIEKNRELRGLELRAV